MHTSELCAAVDTSRKGYGSVLAGEPTATITASALAFALAFAFAIAFALVVVA